MLLDYVAANEIHLEEVAELVEGAAAVCREAGVALVGGETAELPGIYAEGELDFAGTAVGVVARADLIDGSTIEAGDSVIGFASAGVHANGFTLVRRVLEAEDYDGDDLLAPTRLYLDVARALRGRAKAFAHITGGGILENLPRILPDGLGASLERGTWTEQPIFDLLHDEAGLSDDDLFGTFNMGLGMILAVAPEHAGAASTHGSRVGTVHPGSGVTIR